MRVPFCLGILLLFVPPSAFAQSPPMPPHVPLASTPITMTRTETELRAEAPDGLLAFRSARDASGRIVVSVTTRTAAPMNLEAVVATDWQSVTWRGEGPAMTPEARQPLERLAAELERRMLQPAVQPQEEWAFRIVSYWADVPIGFPMATTQTIRRERRSVEGGSVSGEERGRKADGGKPDCATGCNVDSDDGIVDLSTPCKPAHHQTKHDACDKSTGQGHCYNSYRVEGGCGRAIHCRGRCGPGCGFTGFGVYSKDCLEHDHCVDHNRACATCPTDKKCGDEWIDAADDFMWGSFSCDDCKL